MNLVYHIKGNLFKGYVQGHWQLGKRMKSFAVEVESGREGRDGQPSVGPVFRNPLSKNEFPPPDPRASTSWDVFRYNKRTVSGWIYIKKNILCLFLVFSRWV